MAGKLEGPVTLKVLASIADGIEASGASTGVAELPDGRCVTVIVTGGVQ